MPRSFLIPFPSRPRKIFLTYQRFPRARIISLPRKTLSCVVTDRERSLVEKISFSSPSSLKVNVSRASSWCVRPLARFLLTIPILDRPRNSASPKRLGKTSPIELQTRLETRLEFLLLPSPLQTPMKLTEVLSRLFIDRESKVKTRFFNHFFFSPSRPEILHFLFFLKKFSV